MVLKTTYNPDKDIPDLSGKVILITGGRKGGVCYVERRDANGASGTAGIGKEAILQFTKHHAHKIFFTGRNEAAATALITEAKAINAETEVVFLSTDHASLVSVAQTCKDFQSSSDRLDVLICNAGIMGVPAKMTPDRYEVQWEVNYLSHALMAKLLMPMLEQAGSQHGDARCVMVSSEGFKYCPKGGVIIKDLKSDQESLGMLAKWYRYGQSKLGMVLLSKTLAEFHPGVKCVSIHPGTIYTGLVGNLTIMDRIFVKLNTLGKDISVAEGSLTTCWAATMSDPGSIRPGGIYGPVGVPITESEYSEDKELGKALWDWTNEQLKSYA